MSSRVPPNRNYYDHAVDPYAPHAPDANQSRGFAPQQHSASRNFSHGQGPFSGMPPHPHQQQQRYQQQPYPQQPSHQFSQSRPGAVPPRTARLPNSNSPYPSYPTHQPPQSTPSFSNPWTGAPLPPVPQQSHPVGPPPPRKISHPTPSSSTMDVDMHPDAYMGHRSAPPPPVEYDPRAIMSGMEHVQQTGMDREGNNVARSKGKYLRDQKGAVKGTLASMVPMAPATAIRGAYRKMSGQDLRERKQADADRAAFAKQARQAQSSRRDRGEESDGSDA